MQYGIKCTMSVSAIDDVFKNLACVKIRSNLFHYFLSTRITEQVGKIKEREKV